jgi:hypothetical protein
MWRGTRTARKPRAPAPPRVASAAQQQPMHRQALALHSCHPHTRGCKGRATHNARGCVRSWGFVHGHGRQTIGPDACLRHGDATAPQGACWWGPVTATHTGAPRHTRCAGHWSERLTCIHPRCICECVQACPRCHWLGVQTSRGSHVSSGTHGRPAWLTRGGSACHVVSDSQDTGGGGGGERASVENSHASGRGRKVHGCWCSTL